MSQTVTIRLSDDQRAELDAAAGRQGLPPATLAARLLVDGLASGVAERVDGDVVAAVLAAFPTPADADVDEILRRATAVALARGVEAGGSGAATAGSKLVAMIRTAGAAERWAPFGAWLATPVHTNCPACRAELPELAPVGADFNQEES